jgi:hypothetical protein
MDSNHRYRMRNNPFWLPRSVPQFAFHNKNRLFRAGDRWFESISLSKESATNLDVGDLVIGTVIARGGERRPIQD